MGAFAKRSWKFWAVAIVVLLAGFWILDKISGNKGVQKHSRELSLICTTDMGTVYHIHPFLEIFFLGERQVIPSGIGIRPGCMNPLHTHDATGKIHLESPSVMDFTLGDFFAVWGKSFDATHLVDQTADATHRVRMTVNGEEATTFESAIFKDGDRIQLYYETVPAMDGSETE